MSNKLLNIDKSTVLVYEDNKADANLISYCCSELGAKVVVAESFDEAQQALEEHSIDIVFVNLLLKRIPLPESIPVVAMGKTEPLISLKIMRYAFACYIPKPLNISSIMLGIQKASSTFLEKENFISDMVNINNLLNEMQSRIAALYKNKTNKVSFEDSVKHHCYYCVNATRSDDLIDEISYEVVAFFQDKGTVYCAHKDDCKVRIFNEFIKGGENDITGKSPLDILEQHYSEENAESFLEFVNASAEKYEAFLDWLYTKKREFCCNKCEKSLQDNGFKKGDNLHSSSEALLTGEGVYCHEMKCPLDNFFELFTCKII